MGKIKHGHSPFGSRSPEYQCWLDMKQRCQNPRSKHFARYGGRGIRVCERWVNGLDGISGFQCFYMDMGDRPKGAALDRIDNDKGYEAGNCRWATQAEQISNRSVTRRVLVDGREMSLTDACQVLGLNRKMVASRIDRGVAPELALSPTKGKHLRRRAA